jgi:undecaprenyl-diphosphatase
LREALRRHITGSLIAGLLCAVAALVFFAWLANEVLAGETRGFDEAARNFVQRIASPRLTIAMRGLTTLGSVTVLLPLAGVAVARLWSVGRRRAAWLLAITMIGATLLDQVLKFAFQRQRPEPFFNTPLPKSYSFPSGHALINCCFFGVTAAILTVRERRRWVRIAIWTVAAVLVALIGFSRIYLGVHYASDVVAGYLAAIVWVFTASAVDRVLRA